MHASPRLVAPLLVLAATLTVPSFAAARDVPVTDVASLRAALDAAVAGDVIVLADGDWAAWFADPGAADFTLRDGTAFIDQRAPLAEVVDDCCGNARDAARSDIGAIEYDGEDFCDTTRPTTAAAAAASRADQP